MRRWVFAATGLVLVACATARIPKPGSTFQDGVEISFESRGALLDLKNLRLAESGTPPPMEATGDDYLLRLSNHAPFAIAVPTQSSYLAQPLEPVPVSPTSYAFAARDGVVAAILFEGFDGRYGFGDLSGVSFLPPGRSLLFPVPKRYLKRDRLIFIEFEVYTNEVVSGVERPGKRVVVFRASELPSD